MAIIHLKSYTIIINLGKNHVKINSGIIVALVVINFNKKKVVNIIIFFSINILKGGDVLIKNYTFKSH